MIGQGQKGISRNAPPAQGPVILHLIGGTETGVHVTLYTGDESVPIPDDMDGIDASADKDILLRLGIIVLGVLIRLLKPSFGLGISDTVLQGQQHGTAIQGRERIGIVEAAVEQGLLFRIHLLQGCRRRQFLQQGIRHHQRIHRMAHIHIAKRLAQQGVAAQAGARSDQIFVGQAGKEAYTAETFSSANAMSKANSDCWV